MTVSEAYQWLIQILEIKGFGTSVHNNAAMDFNGRALPWISYPAIDYVNGLDLKQKRLFEFGAGSSTLFWADRCKEVLSVENNPEWFEKVRPVLPPNCKVLLCEQEEPYLQTLLQADGLFDIIIIDGALNRRRMAEVSLGKLAPDGLIVLDNSDCHVKAAETLRKADLIQVDFIGFAPMNPYEQATSFFFTRHCRLQPSGQWQPRKSAGTMAHYVDE